MENYVLSIDRGSTNVKAILFDVKGNDVASASYPCQKPVSVKPGWWEQDMNQMWETTAEAIKRLLGKGFQAEDIAGVFVTGQGNGMMPVDKNNEPFRMGILSLDSRSAEIYEQWAKDGRGGKAAQLCGFPISVGSPYPLLAWFMKEAPEEFEKMHKILFSKDWIRYKLSGVLCTDQTDASGAGLLYLADGNYAEEVFEMLGIREALDKMPPIRQSHEVVGTVTEEAAQATGLKKGTPVLCGAHDLCAYPFGLGTLDAKQLVSVVGTWGINLIQIPSHEGAINAIRHSVPGYYVTGVGDGNSGGCLDILFEFLCGGEKVEAEKESISLYDYVENLVLTTRPTGILFYPYIFGSLFDSLASGGFYGIKNWHKKEDILRAVYEGIVMGHYAYIRMITGYQEFESMWLIGGGSNSRIFGQMFADITGFKVKVPHNKEITARGGAMNAWVGLGAYENHKQACIPPEIEREYIPNPEMREFYRKKFELFCRISELNKEIWPVLNELNL